MNWKKTLTIAINIIIGIYLVLAVTAFNKPSDRSEVCRSVIVTIEKGIIEGFLDAQEVNRILASASLNPVGKPLADINLRAMEEALQRHDLIDHAECYKTQGGDVRVTLKERVPVMRVMTAGGDYYVSDDGNIIDNTGYACNVIVATGSIDKRYASRVLAPIGRVVMQDDFWRNQIEQVNILPDSTVEMVPRVGGHILYLGRPVDVRHKLERLRKFYKYGLSCAGWNNYSRISVEFNNQIICKKDKHKK